MINVNEIIKTTQSAIRERNTRFVLDYEKKNAELIKKVNDQITKSANLGSYDCRVETNRDVHKHQEINNNLVWYLKLKGLYAREFTYTTVYILWRTAKFKINTKNSSNDEDDVKLREGLSFDEESAYYNDNETSNERSERLGHDCMWTKQK